jgi:hypothetical protein
MPLHPSYNKVYHMSFKSGLVDHARLKVVVILVAVVLSTREPKMAMNMNTIASSTSWRGSGVVLPAQAVHSQGSAGHI